MLAAETAQPVANKSISALPLLSYFVLQKNAGAPLEYFQPTRNNPRHICRMTATEGIPTHGKQS
jgi:hypothetical protein